MRTQDRLKIKETQKSIQARCIVSGSRKIRAALLFSSEPIAFLQGVDPEAGMVSDSRHNLFGKRFAGKILVFPNAIGSSVGAYVIYRLQMNHVAPKAMINQSSDIITASGCAISGIPLYDLPSSDISELKDVDEVLIDQNKNMIIFERDFARSKS